MPTCVKPWKNLTICHSVLSVENCWFILYLLNFCSENEEKFSKILPWLGQFYLEMSMMNTKYKRYHGNELDELLVIANAAGSVDWTLKGKHDRRGLCCLRPWYKCQLFQLLKDKSVYLLYDVQEKLDILSNSWSSVEKECTHEDLKDLNEANDLITRIFLSVTM